MRLNFPSYRPAWTIDDSEQWEIRAILPVDQTRMNLSGKKKKYFKY